MFFGRKDITQLHSELDVMKVEIAANPLSKDCVQEAQSLIEEMKADGRETEIDEELANRHLPLSDRGRQARRSAHICSSSVKPEANQSGTQIRKRPIGIFHL